MASIFNPIFVAHKLEIAVMDTLARWMPTYLAEIENQLGAEEGRIPAPRTYTTKNEFSFWPADQYPVCVVVSPGLAEAPRREGNGNYTAWWSLGVGVIASANTEEATNNLSKIYAAAVRAIMLQQQTMSPAGSPPVTAGIEWLDESYDDLPDENQERTLRASMWVGMALIDSVVTSQTGPLEPDPDQAGSEWPLITSGSIIVVKED